MGIYERIAMLEGMAKTKRAELELIESEIKRLRDEEHNGFEQFKAEIRNHEPVPCTPNKGGGIRL